MIFKRTLGLKIGLFFLIVALLPFVGISALSYFQTKHSTGNVIRENLANLSFEIGIDIERTIFSAHTHIKSLAENPIIKSEHAPIEEKLLEMRKMHNLYKVFEDVTLVNPEGLVMASTTYDYRGEWRFKEWFKRAGRGEAAVSPVHAILYPFRLIIIVTTPVVGEDDAVYAVLAGRVNLERIWEITDRVKIGKTGFVFITDKNGNIIATPDKDQLLYKLEPEGLREKILSGKKGTSEYLTAEGVDKICYYSVLKGYQKYKGQGWRIGITQDTKEAYGLIKRMQLQILLVAVASLILIIILASLLSYNIVKPIKAFAKAAGNIAQGDMNTQVTVRSKDEIGDLGDAFNKMAEDLKNTTVSVKELQKSEKALRREKDKVQKYLDVAGVMLVAIDADQTVTLINKKGCEILEYNEKEIIGKNWFNNFLPKRVNKEASTVFRKLMAGEVELIEYFENPVTAKSGEERFIAWHNTTLRDENGHIHATLSSGEDITERKRMEGEKERIQSQLLHAKKMEAIGTMAGGIAHDFNNILTVILGNAQLITMDLDPTDSHYELLKEIEKQGMHASTLTRQLLGFARGGKYEVNPISLNKLVRGSSTAFGRTKKHIPIHLTLQEDLPPVEADAGQIEQVLMNLYMNAAYAMPDGGDLYLETRAVSNEKIKVRPSQMKSGEYVLLSIRDTGLGMDNETRERIFDPFFTTREMGRSTGLGLASVYGIIENHKGYINVKSEKGLGTTFEIYLPISENEATKPVKIAARIIKGTETILLVDDEEQVLKLGVLILNTLGYTVLEAENGREAVDAFKREKDKIDLVILDIIMPDMGGDKVYNLLKEINPDIKVLLCSGYSIDGHATEILELGCNGFIQKPFTVEALSYKIREILEG